MLKVFIVQGNQYSERRYKSMWLDNVSDIDMLFYHPYAQLIINTVKKKEYNPLTIGLFGLWGAGKSTLLELIHKGIDEDKDNVACVRLNAWMFEGYEDAKSALMESLLYEIKGKEGKFTTVKGSIEKLLKRVNIFKLGTSALTKGIPLLASVAAGNPIPLTLSLAGDINKISELAKGASDFAKEFKSEYIKDPEDSKVENIRKFRKDFEDLLKLSHINNLVVLVDDLDRCTPDRIIDTLEAIKLFLSVKRTTFIIAADETVIQYAIKKKYPPIDGSSVEISKEYIEKIIQLPITIPDLSSKDIENYLMLLVAQLYMEDETFKKLIQQIFDDEIIVRDESISLSELNGLIGNLGDAFKGEKEKCEYTEDVIIINSIKSIVSSTLKGNPRQAKRFLNTFVTKKELSKMYFKDGLDMKILAKLLALQKINPDLFKQLNEWNKEYDGINKKLKDVYEQNLPNPQEAASEVTQWMTPRMIKWLQCEPCDLYTKRLDKYFYLSREDLKDNNQLINGLSEHSKQILEKISNANEATIGDVIVEFAKMQPNIVDEVIDIIIRKIQSGDIEIFTVRRIFEDCISYRGRIMTAVKIMPQEKLGAPSIAYLIAMLGLAPDIVRPILDDMKGKNLNQKIYDRLIQNYSATTKKPRGQ